MQTYKASYRWTLEELLRAKRNHLQTNLRPSIIIAVNIVSVLLAALSIFILIDSGLKSAIVSTFTSVGFVIWWLFRHRTTRWWAGRGFDKRPDSNVLVDWEISEENIKSQCEGLASSEVQWKIFIKVVETNDGFLLYTQKNLFHWLPFSAFAQPEGVEKVRQFAKANGVKYLLKA